MEFRFSCKVGGISGFGSIVIAEMVVATVDCNLCPPFLPLLIPRDAKKAACVVALFRSVLPVLAGRRVTQVLGDVVGMAAGFMIEFRVWIVCTREQK